MEFAAGEKKGAAGNGDHFIVEDLLDFSNDEVDLPEEEELRVGDEVVGLNFSAESSSVTAADSCNSSFDGEATRGLNAAGFSGELCEPQYDELAELEWLSNFVEESFSTEDLHKLHLISAAGIKSNTTFSSNTFSTLKVKPEPVSTILTTIPSPSSSSVTNHTNSYTVPCTSSDPNLFRPLPAKARSKRSRSAGPSNWASRLILISPDPTQETPSVLLKKPKKQFSPPHVNPSPFNNSAASEGRRCLHCQTDKTPQWRTGPMGPKTLCNACGVRYKSGRLVPEYRPASSPTFIVAKHSNSHRKVLELRRQKEVQMQHQQIIMHGTTPIHGQNGDDFLIHHRIGPDYRQLI